jgi:hypothetical protein
MFLGSEQPESVVVGDVGAAEPEFVSDPPAAQGNRRSYLNPFWMSR